MVDILTGTAFDATERLHHREDELTAQFPSSATSRVRHLNALKAQNWRAAKKGWTNPYATDGLVAMWDGIWNAGGGIHDANAERWVDLSGNGSDAVRSTNYQQFGDLGLVYDGDSTKAWTANLADIVRNSTSELNKYVTIEIALTQSAISNNAVIYHCGYNQFSARFAGGVLYLIDGFHQQLNTFYSSTYGISFWAANTTIPNVRRQSRYGWSRDGVPAYDAGDFTGQVSLNQLPAVLSFGNGGGTSWSNPWTGILHCLRIYNRKLTDEEVAANYAVDRARFGLA